MHTILFAKQKKKKFKIIYIQKRVTKKAQNTIKSLYIKSNY